MKRCSNTAVAPMNPTFCRPRLVSAKLAFLTTNSDNAVRSQDPSQSAGEERLNISPANASVTCPPHNEGTPLTNRVVIPVEYQSVNSNEALSINRCVN